MRSEQISFPQDVEMTDRREIYRSSDGDVWSLARSEINRRVVVVHDPNLASGGRRSEIDLGPSLSTGAGPEQQALLLLIDGLIGSAPTAA